MGIQVYRDISVDFSNGRYIIMNAKQHDSKSRYIRLTCMNCGQKINLTPDNYSAFIRYRKPDGYGAFNSCVISTNGTVIFELTEQMLSTVGTSYADLIIVDVARPDINDDLTIISEDGRIIENNGSIISSMVFYINVLAKPIDDWDITSTNEFSALNDLLIKATRDYEYIVQVTKEYMDSAKESEENARDSAEKAEASAGNAKLSEINAKHSEENALAYANNAKQSADTAKTSETNASVFAANAKASADAAKLSETNSANSADESRKYANNAKQSALNASESETNSSIYADSAKSSADVAKVSENNSKVNADNAMVSADNAKKSEISAKESENDARDEMILAFNSALLAKSYTHGDTSGILSDDEWNNIIVNSEDYIPVEIRENEATDNAKYYKEQAAIFADVSAVQADNAKISADNAKTCEDAAKAFADSIEESALISRSYAVGDTGTREGETTDSAKYYYEQSKQIYGNLKNITPENIGSYSKDEVDNYINSLKDIIGSLQETVLQFINRIEQIEKYNNDTTLLSVDDGE